MEHDSETFAVDRFAVPDGLVTRISVPGGWIYVGGPLTTPVVIQDPRLWAPAPRTASILAAINRISLEILTMSTTLSGQLDADTAALQSDLANLTSGITSLEQQLAAAVAGLSPGSTITQAQVDGLGAIHSSFAALAASIPAAAPATPPAATDPSTTPTDPATTDQPTTP